MCFSFSAGFLFLKKKTKGHKKQKERDKKSPSQTFYFCV